MFLSLWTAPVLTDTFSLSNTLDVLGTYNITLFILPEDLYNTLDILDSDN